MSTGWGKSEVLKNRALAGKEGTEIYPK